MLGALSDQLAKSLPNYQELSQGNTSVNTLNGYEFRFKGVFKDTPKGDLPYWGRVVFLPPGNATEKNGVTIIMLATSLAAEVTGPDDLGVKGELPLIPRTSLIRRQPLRLRSEDPLLKVRKLGARLVQSPTTDG